MNDDRDPKPTAEPRHARRDGVPSRGPRAAQRGDASPAHAGAIVAAPVAVVRAARRADASPSNAGAIGTARVAVVGAGRLGSALAVALATAGIDVTGPLRRDDAAPSGVDAVLLCVPDEQIASAASALAPSASGAADALATASGTAASRPSPLVGHCSAATTLAPLAAHEAFSLHPLMTVTGCGATFAGAPAAIAGTTPRALAFADDLARALRMHPVHVADEDRGAYHAAASIASNFLVTLEGVAERLAATAGIGREQLVALVRASVENWAAGGAPAALTGPIARGDERTVCLQRAAVADRAPQDLELFDALTTATRRLARERLAPA